MGQPHTFISLSSISIIPQRGKLFIPPQSYYFFLVLTNFLQSFLGKQKKREKHKNTLITASLFIAFQTKKSTLSYNIKVGEWIERFWL